MAANAKTDKTCAQTTKFDVKFWICQLLTHLLRVSKHLSRSVIHVWPKQDLLLKSCHNNSRTCFVSRSLRTTSGPPGVKWALSVSTRLTPSETWALTVSYCSHFSRASYNINNVSVYYRETKRQVQWVKQYTLSHSSHFQYHWSWQTFR